MASGITSEPHCPSLSGEEKFGELQVIFYSFFLRYFGCKPVADMVYISVKARILYRETLLEHRKVVLLFFLSQRRRPVQNAIEIASTWVTAVLAGGGFVMGS